MWVTDDELTSSESGFHTPPLSPTKTISTEGWSSPRTPRSPRKSRSCLFFRDVDHDFEDPLLSPPSSPTKLWYASQLGAFSIPEVLSPTGHPTAPDLTDESLVKRDVLPFDRLSSCPSLKVARSSNRSLPDTFEHSKVATPFVVPSLDSPKPLTTHYLPKKQRRSQRSSYDSSIGALVAKYATPPTTPAGLGLDIKHVTGQPTDGPDSPTKIFRLPMRCASSPLRPSQWASRGGLLSPPRKSQTSTPDRFIHCRRSPAAERESFELSKPIERGEIFQHGHRVSGDPFSRRVRRSDRLNAELRGLREAHALTTRRPGGNVRNPNLRLRTSSLMPAARQISAGAIWNVGGPSAVSDTVAAISTGNGGMLGSRTTAPLYTSTFLSRADPEAELEAYERRLALALEVNQTDRILQHSPFLYSRPGARHNESSAHRPHSWRDGKWTQDGIKPCSFCGRPNFYQAFANKSFKLLDDRTRKPKDLFRSYLLDTSKLHTKKFVDVDVSLQSSMHLNCETTITAPCLHILTPLNVLP